MEQGWGLTWHGCKQAQYLLPGSYQISTAISQIHFYIPSFWSYSTPKATEDDISENNGADLTINILLLLLLLTHTVTTSYAPALVHT